MAATSAPFQQLTPDHQGPGVVVITYTLVITSILFTTVRIITNYALRRGFGCDDASVLAATILALIQSILTERAVDSGLGRYMARLDSGKIESYYKFAYASEILAIFVMASAKLSVSLLIQRLNPQRSTIYRACHIVTVCVGLWTVFSAFALAFQCGTPHPWVYTPERCSGRGAVWYPVVVFNILTDVALTFIFVPVLMALQMRQSRQLVLTFLFVLRIVVCMASIAQLILLAPSLHSSDQTWSMAKLVIINQVVMNLSIITANIPSLSAFLSELQSGSNVRIPDSRHELSPTSSAKGKDKGASRASVKWSARELLGKNVPTFKPDDGTQLSSRIFTDNTTSNKDKKKKNSVQTDEEVRKQRMSENGVLQTWELSQKAENGRK